MCTTAAEQQQKQKYCSSQPYLVIQSLSKDSANAFPTPAFTACKQPPGEPAKYTGKNVGLPDRAYSGLFSISTFDLSVKSSQTSKGISLAWLTAPLYILKLDLGHG
ncbi:hypothetical protein PoB_002023800 [Plakobranchus ocellatus]|uniref:Uncharacterized protein n=1 Tax=Plakobranchus ocellatus TaxID=259542 RepID=A0AAV3ZGL0_9GAST|nr:hypothetical protein PoB_002023800 [Plakobranchus ocellatus]